ncbi:MAG TPA: DUF6790 family protein [Gammaproteobacteria bacterium]|jgi:hypothetical protein|nr:DUF6790 family protein [Gammaproteobacteria bacterium]
MDWASNSWYVFIVGHFAFIMFILALIVSGLEWIVQKARHRAIFADILLRWTLLFPVGVTSLYLFVMYSIFPNAIGSAESLAIGNVYFSYGIANLCIGLLGVFSFFKSYDFRSATVLATVVWLWGNVIGQICQLVSKHNLGILNVDSWFWMGLIIPIILIICIIKLRPGDLTVYNP